MSRKRPAMANPFMLAALEYEAKGYSVIPLKPKDKTPLIPSWTPFQTERATREQIGEWWRTWKDANIGIVTGAVSGLFVVDCDSPEAATDLKPTLGDMAGVGVAATGKGFHLYYAHGDKEYPNKAAIKPHVDFRGDGGYVVAPPSIHASGKTYEWAKPINGHLRALPDEFIKLMTAPPGSNGSKAPFDTAGAISGLPEGQRDVGMFKLACKLRGADVPYVVALELCEQAAANCVPPFRNALRKVDQAYKYPAGHSGQQEPVQGGFWPEIMTASQLIDLPPDPTRWVWNECLPLRSTSALIAKAYTGKSTFACSLAMCVARGIDFLNRPTQQGAVLYVYLDGPIDELKENLTRMGLCRSDPLLVYAGRKPDNVVEWVKQACVKENVKLLIIDTAQKFFGFKEDKYEEKINKMQPMLDLVNEHNFHAMFTYHAAKNSVNTVSALGSVAVEANARVSLYLRKLEDSKYRIFDTEQNTGKRFESIGLSDPANGILTKTGTLYDIEIERTSEDVLRTIAENPGIVGADLRNEVQGRWKIIGMATAKLKKEGKIEWTGKGKKGDPERYYVAGSLIPGKTEEPEKTAKVIDLFGERKGQL